MIWISFIICTGIIVFSGIKLSKYGDILAEKTGLGRTWIGIILMASVTSLPEMITGLSSVALFDLPEIAVGGIVGSCVFNLFILSIVDALTQKTPISSQAHHSHILSAGFGVLMLAITGFALFTQSQFSTILWFGGESLILLFTYIVAMKLIFLQEKRRLSEVIENAAEELEYGNITMKRTIFMYAINSILIIAASLYLPDIGQGIAEQTGLGQTFVGNLFIALSTSLPEVVVSITAVRMGAIDLAFGNLFGSNLFNLAILGIEDLFYTKGSLLANVTTNHLIPTFSALMMTATGVIALSFRAKKKALPLGWDTIAIALVYIISTYLLYNLR